ncbi:MAG: hypothetical protein PHP44_15770 [Kiritimatiellae bacterium]|nr:hypothetical protein [Kiritimatiellia bacterium]
MNALRMTTETRPCLMLEGIPLRLMLEESSRKITAHIRREAEDRAYADDDLTDGEQVFGKVVNS